MQKTLLIVLTLIACAVGFPAVVFGQEPTFDCAKAKGEVEKLICSDASLAALDRKLGEVYKATVATARATGNLVTQLRTEQRG